LLGEKISFQHIIRNVRMTFRVSCDADACWGRLKFDQCLEECQRVGKLTGWTLLVTTDNEDFVNTGGGVLVPQLSKLGTITECTRSEVRHDAIAFTPQGEGCLKRAFDSMGW
jgi:hypothetical protein